MQEYTRRPLFFRRNRVRRIYEGGLHFADFFGDERAVGYFPEEWIASTVCALNKEPAYEREGLSILENTEISLKELIERYPEEMLGGRKDLGVLVKLLDSAVRLPLQVHPDKNFSRTHFQSDYGKVEMWLILEADEGACINFGFREKTDRQAFEQAIEDSLQDKDALTKFLNPIPVKAGEIYLIPAKAVHAIGAGCLILEVQEPTDFTIQPEYWCGSYKLNAYEMYLGLDKETAIDCFDFSIYGERCRELTQKFPRISYEKKGLRKEILISEEDTSCFLVNRYLFENGKTELKEGAGIYIVTKGQGCLKGDGYERKLKKGDYFFLPYAAAEAYEIQATGEMVLVECLPPKEG